MLRLTGKGVRLNNFVRGVNAMPGGSSSSLDLDLLRAPFAAFSQDVITGAAPLTVTFTDESFFTPTSWYWQKKKQGGGGWEDFADSAAENPVEDFDEGIWSVKLTARNDYGVGSKVKNHYIEVTA